MKRMNRLAKRYFGLINDFHHGNLSSERVEMVREIITSLMFGDVERYVEYLEYLKTLTLSPDEMDTVNDMIREFKEYK